MNKINKERGTYQPGDLVEYCGWGIDEMENTGVGVVIDIHGSGQGNEYPIVYWPKLSKNILMGPYEVKHVI